MNNTYTLASFCLLLASSAASAADPPPQLVRGQFTFSTFHVPVYSTLDVQRIDNRGQIVGSYDINSGAVTQGYERSPSGSIRILRDPLNTPPSYTVALGINDQQTIAGAYFDNTSNQYSGFLLQGGAYTTYNVPGLPAGSATVIFTINDLGDFGGIYELAPAYQPTGFISERGALTTMSFPGATQSYIETINNEGQAAGLYNDGLQSHGFIRSRTGGITVVDVPGTQAGPGDANHSGTVLEGINSSGWTSGHFWDAAGLQHGFMRSPTGVYYQIDVPGAVKAVGLGTAGGSLNDACTMAGHFDEGSGPPQAGYIATPKFACK